MSGNLYISMLVSYDFFKSLVNGGGIHLYHHIYIYSVFYFFGGDFLGLLADFLISI